ncbi:uncharacterized protein MELLADRAFT_102355 [Melampsora larici-populina 98AG31]|uniref:Uncharacterized protein n=1 Tax=Melampsora larici-populina (strain 98AG31 / pathotype 3-4-7) TaxID=747676 RepID=F4R808_MELLP|nr:uncharacterized protein MELLADRAFT_102355 [Melampsora larici-populina 98AG31]EGG11696.1 hypothetical protein MELLADRAFT_102355 [Melampsora larici-populina 98AG31]
MGQNGHHHTKDRQRKAEYAPPKPSVNLDTERKRLKNAACQNQDLIKILNNPSKPHRKFCLVRVEDNLNNVQNRNGPLKKPFKLEGAPVSMSQQKLFKLKFISTYLRNERKYGNPVKSNCAMLKGFMGAVGHCKAYNTRKIGEHEQQKKSIVLGNASNPLENLLDSVLQYKLISSMRGWLVLWAAVYKATKIKHHFHWN